MAAMLARYTGKDVTSEVNFRELYHICLCQVRIRLPTLALKPKGNVTRSKKQGCHSPHKWTCVQQKLLKDNNFIMQQFYLRFSKMRVLCQDQANLFLDLPNYV